MEPITSRANARLKAARKLQAKRNRLTAGLFLAEGEDIVEEALSEGILPAETFVAAGRPPDEALIARRGQYAQLYGIQEEAYRR